jgi:hypothetical protein
MSLQQDLQTTTIHLDWLRYTVPWNSAKTELENITGASPQGELSGFTGETLHVGQGYDKGLRMIAGAVLWSEHHQEQGISVQLTGDDLQAHRSAGNEEFDLLQWVELVGGHCSTLHGCINVHDSGGKVAELIEEHEAGRLAKRARKIGVFTSKSKVGDEWQQGDTLYVGSAKSDTQIRIYNKAAEQGIKADWLRMEIVWRGRYAKAAHASMMAHGIELTIRTAIVTQLGCLLSWWVEAMRGDTGQPISLPNKESARAKWLRQVVLPALMSELAEERSTGGNELLHLFSYAIDKFRGENRSFDNED